MNPKFRFFGSAWQKMTWRKKLAKMRPCLVKNFFAVIEGGREMVRYLLGLILGFLGFVAQFTSSSIAA
jgi:hypothetical protein